MIILILSWCESPWDITYITFMTHSMFDLGSGKVYIDALFTVFVLINHRSSNTCQGALRCVVYCLILIIHKTVRAQTE